LKLGERYWALLALADQEEPPLIKSKQGRTKKSKDRNLRERLGKWEASVVAFTRHTEVPFTNSLGERDLRPGKTKLKVSGCWRTRTGAERYAGIKGFALG